MMMMMMGIYVAFLAQTDNLRSSSTAFASLILAFFNHNGDHSNTGFVLKDTSCVNGTKVELDLHCSKGGEGGGSNNDGGTAAGQQTTICGFGDQAIITAKVTLSTTTAAAADGSAVLPTAIDIVGNACLFGSFLCKSIAFSDVVICDYMKGYVYLYASMLYQIVRGLQFLTDMAFPLFPLFSVTDGACPSSGNTYTGNFDFLLEGDPMFLGHCKYQHMNGAYRWGF